MKLKILQNIALPVLDPCYFYNSLEQKVLGDTRTHKRYCRCGWCLERIVLLARWDTVSFPPDIPFSLNEIADMAEQMKYPIVDFTPFSPDRVPLIRAARNMVMQGLNEAQAAAKTVKKDEKKKAAGTKKEPANLFANVPVALDAATQRMVLEALKNARK